MVTAPEFAYDGQGVSVVSQMGGTAMVYDANTSDEAARIGARTPPSVSTIGARIREAGL